MTATHLPSFCSRILHDRYIATTTSEPQMQRQCTQHILHHWHRTSPRPCNGQHCDQQVVAQQLTASFAKLTVC